MGLKQLKVRGYQQDLICSFHITQVFENTLGVPVESEYIIPTHNELCIYDTSFTIGDETIKLILQDITSAKATFDQAIEQNKTAVIGMTDSRGITKFVIGNIPPKSQITCDVKCVYVASCPTGYSIEWQLPLKAAAQYGESLISSLVSSNDIGVFQFEHELHVSEKIRNAKSNYAPDGWLTASDNVRSVSVSSKFGNEPVLNVSVVLDQPIKSKGYFTKDGLKYYTSLHIAPKIEADTNSDFIFLVDCSGSMSGDSIRNASDCMQLFLRSLPDNCCFDIVRFGSSDESLFNQLVPYNQSNFETALKLAVGLDANLGGTNIFTPLDKIFKRPNRKGRVTQVFILTDGEVDDKDSVITLAAKHRKSHRILSVGIGTGVDKSLVNGIAQATNGEAVFATKANEIADVVMPLLDASFKTCVTDLSLEIEGSDSFEVSPYPLPYLFDNSVDVAFIEDPKQEPKAIIITGFSGDNQFNEVVDRFEYTEQNYSKILFAYNSIKSLESKLPNDTDGKIKQRLISLSIESGILSDVTAFVGVSNKTVDQNSRKLVSDFVPAPAPAFEEEYGDPSPKRMKCCSKPAMMCKKKAAVPKSFMAPPSGGGCPPPPPLGCPPPPPPGCPPPGYPSPTMAGCPPPPSMGVPPPAPAMDLLSFCCAPSPSPMTSCAPISGKMSVSSSVFSSEEPQPKPTAPRNTMKSVVDLLDFKGYWTNVDKVCQAVSIPVPQIPPEISSIPDPNVFPSIVALAILRSLFGSEKAKWSIIERKCLKYLNQVSSSINWEDLISQVSARL